jgi:glycosyltransferase involved in cell wall biosynthesis
MNIVMLSNTMGRGGAEMQIKDYAVRLVRRGHRVLVISMLPFEDFEDELIAGGVATATLDMGRGKASATALGRLVALLVRFRPDVIHAHMFSAILASRIARAVMEPLRLAGHRRPAIIGTSHAPFEKWPRRYVAYRLTDPLGDLWTNVCQRGIDEHERQRAVRKGRGRLTSNGIEVAAFRPDAGDGEFLWLTAGSFRDDHKDYPNLVRAASKLDRSHEWRIAIAGEGLLLPDIQALVKSAGIEDRVMFIGLRSDVRELMQAADAFVLASWSEAMPIVLLESGASGLPAVVTDVGESAKIVPAGTGFVVPAKNADALASAMRRMQEMPAEERRSMGRAALDHVAKAFSLDVIVNGWEARYREIVSRIEAGQGHPASSLQKDAG